MTYLLLDDGFARHPKILELTDAQLRIWINVLCWAAAYAKEDGAIPKGVDQTIPGLQKVRSRLRELGLLDVETLNGSAADVIHDWYLYTTASAQEKVRWYLKRYPEAPANEVVRQVRGNRQVVLDAVREYRQTGSQNGSDGTTEPVPKPVHARTWPVPSHKELSSVVESVERLATDDDDKIDNEEEPVSPEVAALMPNLKEL